jgi:protein-tyrosine kinase
MSNFKKALHMLRKGPEPNPDERKSYELTDSERGNTGAAQPIGQREEQHHQGVGVRSRHLPDHGAGAGGEILPNFRVSVSAEKLRDQGLRPQDSDLDLVAQQFRRIKRPILNIAFGVDVPESENSNVIMLGSALPGTGKTFCSFNLAASIAKEKDVGAVLVDADVLKPNISVAFGLQDRPGLIDYLLDSSISIDDILVATNVLGIIVVPTGQQHDQATELLASQRMKQFVESLSQRFRARAIIFDTPPLLLTNEAQVLTEHMGQIVLVIEAGKSTQETVGQALNSLNKDKPINAILNKARGESPGEYGGYGYYSAPRTGYGRE